jgi:hypothetical protein
MFINLNYENEIMNLIDLIDLIIRLYFNCIFIEYLLIYCIIILTFYHILYIDLHLKISSIFYIILQNIINTLPYYISFS